MQRNFNPRTREGCDYNPRWGGMETEISIHAPVKGATRTRAAISFNSSDFNPRTREGCDCCGVVFNDFPEISIHAPVKGATRVWVSGMLSHGFQSTHP